MRLECAHVDHNRNNPAYDEPENGYLVTVYEHLHDPEVGHMSYRGMPTDENGLLPNGLTPEANEYAIQQITKRLPKIYNERQLELALR